MKFLTLLMAALLMVSYQDADARRMGGGRSVGQQSANVTQRQAPPPAAATPAASQQPTSAAASSTGAAGAAAQPRRFGGLLGGLAAGLGLAWLAHSLGLGAEFGQFLLLGLLALGVMAVFGFIMRQRRPNVVGVGNSSHMAYSGGAGAQHAPVASQYSPRNVGNDASARPWESDALAGGSMIGSALPRSAQWEIPAGFDVAGFLTAAKQHFMTLQTAWDKSDMATLRSMMTDSMLLEIQSQLSEREALRGANQPNQTDVVMLEAQLLGIEDLGHAYLASVEFSGMIREEPSAGPSPFREVWNMTKPADASTGWLVAGVQALQ